MAESRLWLEYPLWLKVGQRERVCVFIAVQQDLSGEAQTEMVEQNMI